jgi:hypothetical protein
MTSTSSANSTFVSSSPDAHDHVSQFGLLFPNHVTQIFVALSYFIVITLTAIMVANRLPTKFSDFREMSWAKIATVITLVDSWLFEFLGGLMVMGVGVSSSALASPRPALEK